MLKYILKRILMVIPVLLGVTVIIFLITRVLASDPAPVVLGEHATTEAMAVWRADNGLEDVYKRQALVLIIVRVRAERNLSPRMKANPTRNTASVSVPKKIEPPKGFEQDSNGSPGRIRTYNPPVNSRMLCR